MQIFTRFLKYTGFELGLEPKPSKDFLELYQKDRITIYNKNGIMLILKDLL